MTDTTLKQPASGYPDGASTGFWRVVAEREISTRLRDKTFLISGIVMLVVVVGSIIGFSIFGDRATIHKVGVTDTSAARVVASASDVVNGLEKGSKVESTSFDDDAAAEKAVRDGTVDAALLTTAGGYEVLGDAEIDAPLSSALSNAAAAGTLESNAEAQSVDLGALQKNTQVGERLLDPDADSSGERKVVSFIFVLLFYITAITFGMVIAQSVTQEKESRVVEILAAAIPIRSLLWGKIIGNTILALGQVVILVVAGVATLLATGEDTLLGLIGPALVWYIVFFVIGFVALSSLWAVAGSLASRQQDLQSTTMPGHVLLFAPYLLAVTAGAGVKTVCSMLPVVSAMMMPARMAESSVPAWQVAVAIVSNLVATVLLVRLGTRIYERTLLRTDRKIGYSEALRPSVSD